MSPPEGYYDAHEAMMSGTGPYYHYQPQGQQGGQQHPQAPQSLDAYNAPGVLAMTAAEMQSVLSPDGGEQYFADGMATGSNSLSEAVERIEQQSPQEQYDQALNRADYQQAPPNQSQFHVLQRQYQQPPSLSQYQQQIEQQQGPTPPSDNAHATGGPGFTNPFAQHQTGQAASYQQRNSLQQQNASPTTQTPPQQSNVFSFSQGYQNGDVGVFPNHNSSIASSGSGSGTVSPGGANNRVPIPRVGSAANTALIDRVQSGRVSKGPMSKEVNVPPRPKPGRKPMQQDDGDAQDRRRTQNRIAQRSFRDRRQQKVSELMDQIEELRNERNRLMAEIESIRSAGQARERRLQAEVQDLRQRLDARRDTRLASVAANVNMPAQTSTVRRTATAVPSTPSAAAHPNVANETDFTTYGNNNNNSVSNSRTAGAFRATGNVNTSNPHAAASAAVGPSRPSPSDNSASDANASTSSNAQEPNAGDNEDEEDDGLPSAGSVPRYPGIEGKEYNCGFCTDAHNCQCRINDHVTAHALMTLKDGDASSQAQGEAEAEGDGEGEGDADDAPRSPTS